MNATQFRHLHWCFSFSWWSMSFKSFVYISNKFIRVLHLFCNFMWSGCLSIATKCVIPKEIYWALAFWQQHCWIHWMCRESKGDEMYKNTVTSQVNEMWNLFLCKFQPIQVLCEFFFFARAANRLLSIN